MRNKCQGTASEDQTIDALEHILKKYRYNNYPELEVGAEVSATKKKEAPKLKKNSTATLHVLFNTCRNITDGLRDFVDECHPEGLYGIPSQAARN